MNFEQAYSGKNNLGQAICTRNLIKFGAILEHITTLAEVPILSIINQFPKTQFD
jgi:hypothetical protein